MFIRIIRDSEAKNKICSNKNPSSPKTLIPNIIVKGCIPYTGADPGFQVRGGARKKNCAEWREARKFLGYFV